MKQADRIAARRRNDRALVQAPRVPTRPYMVLADLHAGWRDRKSRRPMEVIVADLEQLNKNRRSNGAPLR